MLATKNSNSAGLPSSNWASACSQCARKHQYLEKGRLPQRVDQRFLHARSAEDNSNHWTRHAPPRCAISWLQAALKHQDTYLPSISASSQLFQRWQKKVPAYLHCLCRLRSASANTHCMVFVFFSAYSFHLGVLVYCIFTIRIKEAWNHKNRKQLATKQSWSHTRDCTSIGVSFGSTRALRGLVCMCKSRRALR